MVKQTNLNQDDTNPYASTTESRALRRVGSAGAQTGKRVGSATLTPVNVATGANKAPLPTRPPWNATRTVTVLWILSFLLYALDRDILHSLDTGKQESTEDFLKRYAAWGAVYIILVAGTDFEVTRELSVAFALVIFLSILLVAPSAKDPNEVVGAKVFNQISKFFDQTQKTKRQRETPN